MVQKQVRKRPTYATVPKLWPGDTFVCIGSGPSLTKADVDYVREKARVIAINNTYQLAPWADVLYACDAQWWRWHKGVPSFTGPKYSLQLASGMQYPDVQVLDNTGDAGIETRPHGLRTGRNSGYQAINLAIHLGAKRIILLGYDMQRTAGKSHYHGDHPNRITSPYDGFRRKFDTLVQPLKQLRVVVINCTRETALTTFPRMRLEEALPSASMDLQVAS